MSFSFDEEKRIQSLRRRSAPSPLGENALRTVAETARTVFDAAAVVVATVDEKYVRPIVAAGAEASNTVREGTFCADTIRDAAGIVVEQGADDARTAKTPLNDLEAQFYAGVPLLAEGTHPVGVLALYDTEPRSLGADEHDDLRAIAELAQIVWRATVRSPQNVADLTSVLEEANEPILITEAGPLDPPGPRIAWVNEAFVDLTGYDRQELVGETTLLLRGPDTDPEVCGEVRSALSAEESVEVEVTNYRKNGCPYVAVVDVAPVRNEDDELTHWISFHHDITDRYEHEEELRYEATHDTLTGLANRAALREEVERVMTTPALDPSALLYLDLDRFKLVNDSLGHSKGDELLVQIADVLRDLVRKGDTVARIGGDEFAVCLPGLDAPEHARALANRIYETLNQPIELGERSVFTPASIGVVVGLSDYTCVEDVLRDADTAMYESKDDPHRPFAVYEEAMTQRVEEQLSMDAELRQALERNEFEPFFQPIIALEDGSVHGFEVLARWKHPERGVLTPYIFLEAAEVTGLIVPIGHQVIRKAAAYVCALQAERDRAAPLALMANFSRQEFFRVETHGFLSDLFDTYDVAPTDFTMEISERTVADISPEDESAFSALKELGVGIVLDDFGTGYSSLQSLRRLPVDGLKIDKELLAEANGRAWDRDLVDLVIQMGHTLNQTVTAEGIETREQLAALRDMECSYGQGYLMAPPVPAPQLDAMLKRPPWGALWAD